MAAEYRAVAERAKEMGLSPKAIRERLLGPLEAELIARYGPEGGRRLNAEGRFTYDLKLPPAVPTTSIYTKADEVVNFRSCLRPDIPAIPVWGTHNGLVVNPEVYRLLGRLLARARR